jgi:quercetin dioxygenase-like cupin family protein
MDEKIKTRNPINLKDVIPVEALPGIFRQTLAYNQDTMLCFFKFEKSAEIPIHEHPNVQIGYIISGEVNFLTEKDDFIASTGDSYVFEANEKHGAVILKNTQLIEVFYPYRPEYEPHK